MAIFIEIRKVQEDEIGAVYEFGTVENIVGHVLVERTSSEFSLLHIEPRASRDFYLTRVQRALQPSLDAGVFPERTSYRA